MRFHIKEKQDYSKVKNSIKIKHIKAEGEIRNYEVSNTITNAYPRFLGGVRVGGTPANRLGVLCTDSEISPFKTFTQFSDYGITKNINVRGSKNLNVVDIQGTSFLEIEINAEYYNSIIDTGPFTINNILLAYYNTVVTTNTFILSGHQLAEPIDINPGDTLIVQYKARVPYPATEPESLDVVVNSGTTNITNVDIDGNETEGSSFSWTCTRCITEPGQYPDIPDGVAYNDNDFYFVTDTGSTLSGTQLSYTDTYLDDITIDLPSYTFRFEGGATLTRDGTSGSRLIERITPFPASGARSGRHLEIAFDPPIEVPYTHTLTVDFVYDIEFSVD